jgi:hypothetical protein
MTAGLARKVDERMAAVMVKNFIVMEDWLLKDKAL